MGTNKERIEQLEVRLDEVQNGLHRMEPGSIWKKLITVSLMYSLQTRNLKIRVIHIVKVTMGDDLLYHLKQQSLNSLDFQEMIQWSGSIG
jgi:hypothetical protein